MLLIILYSDSASSITPVELLKPRFLGILKFVYLLVVNNIKYFTSCCWHYHIRNQRSPLPLYNPWNHASGTILKFVYFLVVNNNKYLSCVVDNIMFRTSVPDYPSRTVESNSLRLFWNFCIFCLLYIHIDNNKFIFHKFKSAKFGFNILDMF